MTYFIAKILGAIAGLGLFALCILDEGLVILIPVLAVLLAAVFL